MGAQWRDARDADVPGVGTLIWSFQLEPKVSRKCVGRILKGWGREGYSEPGTSPIHTHPRLDNPPRTSHDLEVPTLTWTLVSVVSYLLLEAKSRSTFSF